MKLIYTILFSLIYFGLTAQSGDVTIHKDPRVESLIKKQGEVIPPALTPEIDGFRIQLYFDSEKQVIDNARAKFVSRYPAVDTYVEYNAPNFILKVGDFRTRLEAEKIKAEVESDFPTSFIVKEKVNLPRLENE